ncbi:uncharacterized protein LOC131633189 [Vicia villosa]|uniref:uncharacterized protein LOC131633189 n=1 Tax=Vicia villosa TaxID=3911 RepID=UPI00273AB6D8|nr:uncharacterized protein LOC131633189 [Vicia villosa]
MATFEALYSRRCVTPLCWYESGESVVVGRKVTPVTGVGKELKSRKLTTRLIGPFHISKRVGEVAYQIALSLSHANHHDVFHVSQLRRYIADPSHIIQLNDVQVRDNLTVDTSPMRIEDREVKRLRGKEIAFVKVIWGGVADGNITWELRDKKKKSYSELFV